MERASVLVVQGEGQGQGQGQTQSWLMLPVPFVFLLLLTELWTMQLAGAICGDVEGGVSTHVLAAAPIPQHLEVFFLRL